MHGSKKYVMRTQSIASLQEKDIGEIKLQDIDFSKLTPMNYEMFHAEYNMWLS